jgi:hypothetical protein
MEMPTTATVESDVAADANTCLDYVDGFFGAIALTNNPICADGASLGTIIRIYVAYMQKNPKFMDADKNLGLYAAMISAYPCKKK